MGETSGPEVVVYGSGDDEPLLLTAEEVRVLGVLVEKQSVTPDTYPLTLNSLVNGCNQTSSRDPIVRYDESMVSRALNGLREKKLAYVFAGADSRTLKYGHKLRERIELTPAETAALCVLLLRGPQTAGEIRTRSGRLHEFSSLAEVDETLVALNTRAPHPLVLKLPRQSGLKESRFAHCLSGEPRVVPPELSASGASHSEQPASAPSINLGDETERLRADIATLRSELSELREQFAQFKKQFE